MPLMDQLTTRALITSLRSCKCPACGGTKKPAMSLCSRDYYTLPAPMRKALYNRVGEGYAEAMHDAFLFLKRDTFQWDAELARPGR